MKFDYIFSSFFSKYKRICIYFDIIIKINYAFLQRKKAEIKRTCKKRIIIKEEGNLIRRP